MSERVAVSKARRKRAYLAARCFRRAAAPGRCGLAARLEGSPPARMAHATHANDAVSAWIKI